MRGRVYSEETSQRGSIEEAKERRGQMGREKFSAGGELEECLENNLEIFERM